MKKRPKQTILYLFINNKALILLVIMSIIAQITTGGLFLTLSNLISILRQIPVSIITAIGFTIVVGSGGFDMSIRNMTSLLACIYAILSLQLPLIAAIGATLLIAILCGLFNGVVTELLNIPPFIITYVTGLLFSAITSFVTGDKNIGGLSDEVSYIGSGNLFGFFPISLLIVCIMAAFAVFMMRKTIYGRRIMALGENRKSLKTSGIQVRKLAISVYVLMGLCCAVGAMLLVGRINLAYGAIGGNILTETITAVFIGGTAIKGGRINMMGTIFSCLIIAVMNNMFGFLEISSAWQTLIQYLFVLLALILESYTNRFLESYYHEEYSLHYGT